VSRKGETFTANLLGHTYTQGAFRYQVKCLAELRWAFSKLDPESKKKAAAVLDRAGCLKPLGG